jgi:hypothetical protein
MASANKHTQLHQQVAEKIRALIADGKIMPGEWLRQEHLAKEVLHCLSQSIIHFFSVGCSFLIHRRLRTGTTSGNYISYFFVAWIGNHERLILPYMNGIASFEPNLVL